ncbi:MAG: response regulator [Chloroflexi bacterium]|nr:MAG: response regulator [Chloroflexota bacterium]
MHKHPGKPRHILIVDDEPTLLFFLKQTLQEIEPGFALETATNGEDALDKLTCDHFDLLITDLKMPGISGFRLSEAARLLHPDIKIILMTAHGSSEVLNYTRKIGADGYLTKPFSTLKLHTLAQELFARTEPLKTEIPSISADTFDLSQGAKKNG